MPTDEERAAFKRAELHRTHVCQTCEAEAVTAALDALAARVAGMPVYERAKWRDDRDGEDYLRRAAVLAAIEEARP